MADSGVFNNIFTLIDDSIIKVIVGKADNIVSVLEPLFVSAFTVYLLFLFLSYWNNRLEDNIVDFVKKMSVWAIVIGFAFNFSNYNQYVVPFVLNFGDDLSQTFSGSNTTMDGSLDSLATIIVDGVKETMEKASGISGTIMAVMTIFLICVSSIIFLIISAGYILLAKVFAGILVVVGPVFIALFLFPATRQFFSAWLNQVINYSLLTLFIHILMAIFVEFMVSAFGTGAIDLSRGFNIALGAGVFFVILLKLPELASGLAGGISANGFSTAGRVIQSVATGGKSLLAGQGKKPNIEPKNSMKEVK